MRTREIFRYLVAMIIALSTTVNAMAQEQNLERNLKIYFNEYVNGETAPKILMTDDNNAYDIPLGVDVSSSGAVWAGKSRFFEWITQTVTDRVMADYVSADDKKHSKLKLTFTDFPYEVNAIQWNAMNDLLSGSLTNFFKNYNVTTTCVPQSGNGFSYTEESWALNPFAHQTGFSQSDIPWKKNGNEYATLKGLKSFEISEYFEIKVGLFNWTILDLGEAELSDKVRTFIKAGWNGSKTNPKIILRDRRGNKTGEADVEGDDRYWAFKVKFTLPDIRMYCYSCRVANNKVTLGDLDNNIIVGERAKHALRGYIAAHAGAVEPTYDPTDIDAFHFEYFADDNQMTIVRTTGVISNAKVAGDIPVTVKLMRGAREVCSYTQTIHVMKEDEVWAKIAIGFENGNKGYDVTVGDQNAQIKGFVTETLTTDAINIQRLQNIQIGPNGCHFEYTESSNGQIIEIDKYTGKITAKKEGDVAVSAVLKYGENIISNTYTYSLHVFAQHEGLEWQRDNIYTYTAGHNLTTNGLTFDYGSWKPKNTNTSPRQWQASDYLKTKTTILENNSQQSSGSSTDSWKQIAWFTTDEFNYWRTVCQKIKMDVHVPKYSKATAAYRFASNVIIGKNKGGCKYGFEVKDLGLVTSDDAHTIIRNITWNTTSSSETLSSSSGNYTTKTIVRNGADRYTEYVGAGSNPNWETDNSSSDTHTSQTRYLAVMAYLWYDHSYPGDFSVGYKDIPTYEYYSTVTYYMNDGTEDVWYKTDTPLTTTDKTKSFKMPNTIKNLPERAGYEFLGWSTDPNATTAEYPGKGGDFCPYDDVNGGGKGPVSLYAVWRANVYTVELRHTSTGPVDGYVYAVYDQNMPLVDIDGNPIKAPENKGYDFNGYFAEKNGTGTKYYNADMSSNHVWDRAETDKNYVIARWIPHTTTVVFDLQGGILYYGATEVNATYGKDMPTEGVGVPQRQGYTFGGYYNKPNGAGTQYYTASMTSARTWDIDERLLNPQVTKVTLYANWIPLTYTVTLDPQEGTGGTTSVTATYGQKLPNGLTAPTKEGYEFKGYYSNQNQDYAESIGQDYGGKQYYDKDMNGVEPWDKTEGGTIYAHWAPKTYIVTFDLGDESHAAIFPDNVVNANKDRIMEITSDGKMKVSFDYGISGDNSIDLSVPKKPGYEMLGWYDANGDLIVTVDIKDRHAYITDKNNYWQKDGNNVKWNYADDLVLTAKFRCKYTVVDAGNGPIIKFDNEIVEPDQDWLSSVISDLQGAAKEVGTPENPIMAFDLRTSKNIWTGNKFARLNVMESLQSEEYKDYISPNVLVYFNDNESEAWYIDGTKPEYQGRNDADCYNAVSLDNKCRNLVVTDRFPIKIPYAFNASKASYARDAKVADNDKGKDQAKNSYWGTLCLPYPIRNNANGVKFYEFQSTANNYFMFEEMSDNEVIPANTPVLYCRTDGGVGSMITIEEEEKDVNCNGIITKDEMVSVPANPNFTALVKSYANAHESIQDWEFRGNLKTNVFCGRGYINAPAEAIANSDITDNGEVYYFKQNKFTRLVPATTKNVNGKETHYDAGKMTLYPYRAYFYKKGVNGSSAKVSAYSILVVGEDGNTTDITDAIFGDGEGDGKIYDLNGIRVMQPVKGRLYIVNGQKKVYR